MSKKRKKGYPGARKDRKHRPPVTVPVDYYTCKSCEHRFGWQRMQEIAEWHPAPTPDNPERGVLKGGAGSVPDCPQCGSVYVRWDSYTDEIAGRW